MIVAVGPLRCLPTIRSASPARGDSFSYASAMEAVKVLEGRRRVAIARAVDTHGRGGQTVLARRLGIKQPTVQELAMRGRADMMRAEKAAQS